MRQARLVKTEAVTTDELDPATGLFRTHVPTWLAAMPPDAVFLRVDLRGFKRVNDDHGFAASEAVLVEIAHRLEVAAAPWPAYRVGGDEFLVIARLADDDELRRFAASVRTAMERPPENHGVWTTMAAARAFAGASPRLLAQLADDGIWAARASRAPEVTLVGIDVGAGRRIAGDEDVGLINRP